MRTLLMSTLLLLPVAASAGDLWLTIDKSDGDGRIHVEVPAVWLLEEGDDVHATVDGKQVDLRVEAKQLQAKREGAKRHYRVQNDEGDTIDATLEHRKTHKTRVSTFDLKLGDGLQMSVGLDGDPSGLEMVKSVELDGSVSVNGFDFGSDGAMEAIRRGGPVTLVEIVGEDGRPGMKLAVR